MMYSLPSGNSWALREVDRLKFGPDKPHGRTITRSGQMFGFGFPLQFVSHRKLRASLRFFLVNDVSAYFGAKLTFEPREGFANRPTCLLEPHAFDRHFDPGLVSCRMQFERDE